VTGQHRVTAAERGESMGFVESSYFLWADGTHIQSLYSTAKATALVLASGGGRFGKRQRSYDYCLQWLLPAIGVIYQTESNHAAAAV